MDTHLSPNVPSVDANSTAVAEFDANSGSYLERLIFRNRPVLLTICILVTLLLGVSSRNLSLNASFEDVIPKHHPFILNYLENQENLKGLGNTLEVVVQANHGSILTRSYIKTLGEINDRLFLLPGVDRGFMQSLWTPSVRWIAVTDAGLAGGPVMPGSFTGSPKNIAQLAENIQRSGQIGDLIAPDFKSSMIKIPLLDIDGDTGKPLDYRKLTQELDALRAQYGTQGVTLHITGFAMIAGDLIQGMRQVLGFFATSVLIAAGMLYWYTRCIRSTSLVVFSSLLAAFWQLGLLPLCGFHLDPYSVLVPFLVFAIGMSHGAQKMNGVMQDIGRGSERLVAARMTFRRLFVAGFTALVCDAVGFAVLMTVRIHAIEELAIIASGGVLILIFTNLIILPVLLSYVGVTPKAAIRSLKSQIAASEGAARHPAWRFLDLFTRRRYAAAAIAFSVGLGCYGAYVSRNLQVGDLDPGAPELRANSQYHRDNAYVVGHYANSSDVFVVMVKTPAYGCAAFDTLADMNLLENVLRDVPGVVSASSFADMEKILSVEFNEGNFDWYDLIPKQPGLNQGITQAPATLVSQACNLLTLSVYLTDHRASTLTRIAGVVKGFAAAHNRNGVSFLMAAGNAGIEAATNEVVGQASWLMLLEIYAAVVLMSFITFRSAAAVLVAILPLVLTSILAQALMVWLNIGIKVATLPVTALGVGIGVDYALYVLSVTLGNMRQGMGLSEAYYRALLFTGKVVMLTGATLAAAVATWTFSPIKFQADMGELLAFMFLWNMLGALILLPALASFLLPRTFVIPHRLVPE